MNQKRKIYVLLFLIFVLGLYFAKNQIVLAINGDYTRVLDGPIGLQMSDWDEIATDFLRLDGGNKMDAGSKIDMNGGKIINLNLTDPTSDGEAATKKYVDNSVTTGGSANIKDTTGANLKMVCGKTNPSDWVNAGANIIAVNINTSAAGFTNDDVKYFTSLNGNSAHYAATGVTSIYFSDRNDFWIYVYSPFGLTTVSAMSSNWYIDWCGLGI